MFSLSDKDYAIFKRYVKEALSAFQLNDWEVELTFEEIDYRNRGDRLASCSHSTGMEKSAEITLNIWWCKKPTKDRLKNVAYHEVLHLLFADMFNIALDIDLGFSQRREYLDGAMHSCINRLLPVLLTKTKETAVASNNSNTGTKTSKKSKEK